MRFYRKLFCMIGLGCLIAASASAGWKEERDFAEKMKKECERSPRQTPYRVNGETIPVEPEFCINIHHLDDKVAANLKKPESKPSGIQFTGMLLRKRKLRAFMTGMNWKSSINGLRITRSSASNRW